MHAMAKALLEWETIDADQINDIIEGRDPRPPKQTGSGGGSTPPAGKGAAGPAPDPAAAPA
jgi:cell division protease FtsH